jgi:hypothetical protein
METPNLKEGKNFFSEQHPKKDKGVSSKKDAVSQWFREMVALKRQYTEYTLKPQREAFEKAIAGGCYSRNGRYTNGCCFKKRRL